MDKGDASCDKVSSATPWAIGFWALDSHTRFSVRTCKLPAGCTVFQGVPKPASTAAGQVDSMVLPAGAAGFRVTWRKTGATDITAGTVVVGVTCR